MAEWFLMSRVPYFSLGVHEIHTSILHIIPLHLLHSFIQGAKGRLHPAHSEPPRPLTRGRKVLVRGHRRSSQLLLSKTAVCKLLLLIQISPILPCNSQVLTLNKHHPLHAFKNEAKITADIHPPIINTPSVPF